MDEGAVEARLPDSQPLSVREGVAAHVQPVDRREARLDPVERRFAPGGRRRGDDRAAALSPSSPPEQAAVQACARPRERGGEGGQRAGDEEGAPAGP
ncbi:hypothetical protein ACFQL4_20450 [Halosimplex aquaticum]